MGRVKEKYLEDTENGFSVGSDIFICENHFGDSDIIEYINEHGVLDNECFFCGTLELEEEIPNSTYKIHSDKLLKGIVSCIKRSYDDPANGLAYESAEGGYYGDTYYTYDLLNEVIPLDADEEVIQFIADSISQDLWTEAEFYGNPFHEELSYSWKKFSQLIKHQVESSSSVIFKGRYSGKAFDILNTIIDFISDLNLFTNIPERTNLFNENIIIYRARQHKDIGEVNICKDICSPPSCYAGTNRFSAEGISMFYGAENEKTAIEEIINREKPEEYITIAEFYPSKQLKLIDLRNIKTIGFFNFENIDLYEPSQFLINFVQQVSVKIDPGQNKKIEYVPSQVVTDFFKSILPSKLGFSIDGLVYKSAQNNGSDCYVIFADNEQCEDEAGRDDCTLLIFKEKSKPQKVSEL